MGSYLIRSLLACVSLIAATAPGCATTEQTGLGGMGSAGQSTSGASAPEYGWELTVDDVGLRSRGLTCGQLPAYTGPSDVPAGTTIVGKRITTTMNLSAGRITIERSCIQPTKVDRGMPVVATTNYNTMKPLAGRVVIRDSEFDGTRLAKQDAAMVGAFVGLGDLINNYVHGFGSGIALMDTGLEFDSLVEHNYVSSLVAWGDGGTTGNHSDAFTIRDFDASKNDQRKAVIRNNRFDCDSGNDTGALFVQTYAGRIDNLTVEGNLLEGGGYQLGLNQAINPYANLRAVNNRFEGTGYGPTYVQGGAGWDVWENNFLYEPNHPDAQGAVVPAP